MADEKVLMKKQQEYIQQQKEELQLSEDFFSQYAQMDQLFDQEAKEQITRENLQQRTRAEKEAGLAQKKIPEQEIPEEVQQKIRDEYNWIHDGEEMSGKEMRKAKKEYKRKIKHTQKAQKIVDNFDSFFNGMTDNVANIAMDIAGVKSLGDSQRQFVASAVLTSVFTGGTLMDTAEAVLNLSVSDKDATKAQAEMKAFEIEKMFNVILNYDIGKLKYKNSEDFLKNAQERLVIGKLATEMQTHLTSYRQLTDMGKLKKPLNPMLLNEIEARVNLIMTSVNRTEGKLRIMANELYAVTDRDSVDAISDEDLTDLITECYRKSTDKSLSEEERRQAKRDHAYYKSVGDLRRFDSKKDLDDRFRRGDDPEKLLAAHRKDVNGKYPIPADYEEKLDEMDEKFEVIHSYEKDGITWFRSSMKHRLEKHASSVNADKKKAAHATPQARTFAFRRYAKHWEILRQNDKLRRQEIQKYYGILHRGKKIPAPLLEKIENEFEKRFEMAKKVDTSEVDATQSEHESRLRNFKEKNADKIKSDRGADAVFYVLRNLDNDQQVTKYNGFKELYHTYGTNNTELPEEPAEKQKLAERLKETNKELIDYVMKFDLKKLEFTDIAEASPYFVEINHYLQVMGELQFVPKALYNVGIVDDAGYLDMQARIELVMGYNWMYQNAVSAGSSVLSALVDTKDLTAVNEAVDIDNYQNTSQIPKNEDGELTYDKQNFENLIPIYDVNNELAQYNSAVKSMRQTSMASYYKPGGSMDEALAQCRKVAAGKLAKLKDGRKK